MYLVSQLPTVNDVTDRSILTVPIIGVPASLAFGFVISTDT